MIRNNEKKKSGLAFSAADTRLWEMQADICQALAHPKRLMILNLLKGGEMAVGAMVEALDLPKANLSQHLGVMRQKGILATRREGTTIYYRLATPHITQACTIMRQVLLEALQERQGLSQDLREQAGPEEAANAGEE